MTEHQRTQEKDGVMSAWVKEPQIMPTIPDKMWPRAGFLTTGKIYTQKRETFTSHWAARKDREEGTTWLLHIALQNSSYLVVQYLADLHDNVSVSPYIIKYPTVFLAC